MLQKPSLSSVKAEYKLNLSVVEGSFFCIRIKKVIVKSNILHCPSVSNGGLGDLEKKILQ